MRTTKKQFEIFKRECLRWQDRLGLNSYDIRFYFEEGEEFEHAWNIVNFDYGVKIFLDKSWCDPTNDEIKGAAKHEMMHVLIGRIQILMRDRYIGNLDVIREAEEELVRRLTKLIQT